MMAFWVVQKVEAVGFVCRNKNPCKVEPSMAKVEPSMGPFPVSPSVESFAKPEDLPWKRGLATQTAEEK
jgi:hypothetical protein